MKCVILAGGLGTRISEETHLKPKPMIEIGGKPILWHILKIYSHFGVDEFVICCGYKGYVIKEYFANYFLHNSDVTIDLSQGSEIKIHRPAAENWKITLVDTGERTLTGGRLKRISEHISDAPFLMTYGDGVADIDVSKLTTAHRANNKLATVTAVQPPGRFGALSLDGLAVSRFSEKVDSANSWINGGFFVLEPDVLKMISSDETSFEDDVLPKLAEIEQLGAYKHEGFWRAMDTVRDKVYLDSLATKGEAPWQTWPV